MMIGETNSDSIYSSWLLHSLAIPSVNDLYTALNTLEYKTVGTNKYVKIFHVLYTSKNMIWCQE